MYGAVKYITAAGVFTLVPAIIIAFFWCQQAVFYHFGNRITLLYECRYVFAVSYSVPGLARIMCLALSFLLFDSDSVLGLVDDNDCGFLESIVDPGCIDIIISVCLWCVMCIPQNRPPQGFFVTLAGDTIGVRSRAYRQRHGRCAYP